MSLNVVIPHEGTAPLNIRRLMDFVKGSPQSTFRLKETHGRYAGALEMEDTLSSRGLKINHSWRVQLTGCKHGPAAVDSLTRLAAALRLSGEDRVRGGALAPSSNLIKVKVELDCQLDLGELDPVIREHSMVASHKPNAPGMTLRPTQDIRASCNASLTLHKSGLVFVNSGGGLVGVAQGLEKMVNVLNSAAGHAGCILPMTRKRKCST